VSIVLPRRHDGEDVIAVAAPWSVTQNDMPTRPAIDQVVEVLRLEIGGADHLPQGIALRVKLADPLASNRRMSAALDVRSSAAIRSRLVSRSLVDHGVQALHEPLHQCRELTQRKRRAERDGAADQLDLAISRQAPGGPRTSSPDLVALDSRPRSYGC
jgi:hypothetical protein